MSEDKVPGPGVWIQASEITKLRDEQDRLLLIRDELKATLERALIRRDELVVERDELLAERDRLTEQLRRLR